jgi:hypothetical protein
MLVRTLAELKIDYSQPPVSLFSSPLLKIAISTEASAKQHLE